MLAAEVAQLLDALRRIGGEPETVEVKRAAGGLPASLSATLSAFSQSDGGVIVLGVDEESEFSVVPLSNPVALRNELAQMARDKMTPPLTISTDVVEVDGGQVVVAQVPPVSADLRPVFVTSQGISRGSYIRAGDDGDRHLTEAEIGLLIANRTQPCYDSEPVPGTSLRDLDRESVARTLQRVRASSATLARVDDAVALRRIGVLASADDDAEVTLGGLLVFGEYPQAHFPQLMVSAVVHPPAGDQDMRFLDNASIRGSIPEMVQATVSMIRRNLAARAVVTERGRSDQLEFPLVAVREAVVNALMHRDYSPATRGTQVQVDLFADRLEVRSPGGIFGGISVEDLGEEGVSSSRNGVLASLLSDAYLPASDSVVAENRASGVPTMIQVARDHGLPRPVFRSTVSSFVANMNRSQLLAPEVRAWIASLGIAGLTTVHEIALAMLRNGSVTNAELRQWGVDRIESGRVLRDLVERRLAIKEGGRRYARYVLDPSALTSTPHRAARPANAPTRSELASVVAALRARPGEVAAREIALATSLSRPTVAKHLNLLIAEGRVEAHGLPRSPARTYRWIG
ncbi:putative transcriptional regulator [Xylanimonas cellulosilytica DSM 15894]|uniref:Transcriptional regulator n=1 Tax=Xylanimonas cellulosilytica (strain DSM 15894 / JCM 12276 / CECT 5975 / KCTC 9989 / LMG 20990 / NBRC 107835 / XIL07) TaxID=446471 RepID=D1BYJ6_XYLCX|nr:ATP-binding protein [Xylanimonas cellulosilytica]ACZ31868.1 putative transcriptional regulator [Xylanimonas cellulosilytica DSM 15894]